MAMQNQAPTSDLEEQSQACNALLDSYTKGKRVEKKIQDGTLRNLVETYESPVYTAFAFFLLHKHIGMTAKSMRAACIKYFSGVRFEVSDAKLSLKKLALALGKGTYERGRRKHTVDMHIHVA